MKCPTCGAPMPLSSGRRKSEVSVAMNEIWRTRICLDGHSVTTIELVRSELQSLRAEAHMRGREKA